MTGSVLVGHLSKNSRRYGALGAFVFNFGLLLSASVAAQPASQHAVAGLEIPEKNKFKECWQASFTKSETYTIMKNHQRLLGGMETVGRRDLVTVPTKASYIFCFEDNGSGALVVNGALVRMVRPADVVLYGDTGEVELVNPPVSLYAEWVRPNQADTALLITLDKETRQVSATKTTADGKLRQKASSMLGTAERVYP